MYGQKKEYGELAIDSLAMMGSELIRLPDDLSPLTLRKMLDDYEFAKEWCYIQLGQLFAENNELAPRHTVVCSGSIYGDAWERECRGDYVYPFVAHEQAVSFLSYYQKYRDDWISCFQPEIGLYEFRSESTDDYVRVEVINHTQ